MIGGFINKKIGKVLGVLLYVLFGCVIVLFEEIWVAVILFKVEKAIMKRNSFNTLFPNLTPNLFYLDDEARNEYVTYFNGVISYNNKRLSVMAREASIQLVYMLTLTIYAYFKQPVIELDYQGSNYPTETWIGLLAWTLISTLLSANSTFPPLLKNLNLTSFRRYKRPATLPEQIVKIIQILLHLFFASVLIFLLRSPIQQRVTTNLELP